MPSGDSGHVETACLSLAGMDGVRGDGDVDTCLTSHAWLPQTSSLDQHLFAAAPLLFVTVMGTEGGGLGRVRKWNVGI